MPSIRIKEVPPGFAPIEIREQWVGIEIPLATQEELDADPPSGVGIGSANIGGHCVLASKAVAELYRAEKQAAYFWDSMTLGRYLVFAKEVCELVP